MQCLYIQGNVVLLSEKGIYLGGINCIGFTLLWRGVLCKDNSANLTIVTINSTEQVYGTVATFQQHSTSCTISGKEMLALRRKNKKKGDN